MTRNREPEDLLTPTHAVPVTTLRAALLDTLGTPQHRQAVTYRFTEPVTLALGRCERPPAITDPPGLALRSTEYLAHLTAPHDHPERTAVRRFTRGLRRLGTPMCVEAWAELEPGTWWYALLPWWRRVHLIPEEWPLKADDGQELHAAGRLRQAGAHTWPPVCPLDEPRTPDPGAAVLIARTTVPPPRPGRLPRTPANPTPSVPS